MSNIHGPEVFTSPQQNDNTSATHKRHNSVANSLVGSIRGLGRKKGKAPELPAQKAVSPGRPAENVPLPSSPINIPVAAPALELDLGPAGFMSSTFASPTENGISQEDLKLTVPANIASGRPESHHLHIPDEIDPTSASTARAATPSDILHIPAYSKDETREAPPSAPATPMPGTNFSLEVDGANSDKSDKSQVFERSVTPHNEKERKELRTMRSLDAMAEACAVAQASDEMNESTEPAEARRQSDPGFSEAPASPELEFYTPRRKSWSGMSGTTIKRCPSDMEVLTRQKAAEPMTASDSQQELWPQEWVGDDPFTAGSGPPSRFRRVLLPFRPKITDEREINAAAFVAEGYLAGDQKTDIGEKSEATGLLAPLSSDHATDTQIQSQRNHASAQGLAHNERPRRVTSSFEKAEHIENLASDDDTQTRAQELLASDIVLLDYDGADSPVPDGLSPHGGPLGPRLYQCIQGSHTPSPGSARSRTTYTASLGDAEYKFTFDNWLRTASTAHAPDDEALRTPRRRSMDVSIDSASTNDERQTQQISPVSSNADHTPSMGNRLEFDLKRSQRNMRYNALQQETEVEDMNIDPMVDRPPIRFILGSSEEIDANAFALADFENAYASSHAGSPQKDSKVVQARIGSEESVADSLKEAASDYNTLEHCLDTIESDANISADPAKVTPASTSSQSFKEWVPEMDLEQDPAPLSDTHPPEKSTAEWMASGVNALKSSGFVPISPVTSQRESVSPIQSTKSTAMEGSPNPVQASLGLQGDVSESSADSPPTRMNAYAKDRVTSSDTLDNSLHLFSSPGSGYQADKSSVSPPARSKAPPASRYGSRSKRASTSKPVGEGSSNIV